MNNAVEFMNGYVGRLGRVIVGTALIGFAYLALEGTTQIVVADRRQRSRGRARGGWLVARAEGRAS